MAAFKVGDRVRINCNGSVLHGREATIWDIQNNCLFDTGKVAHSCRVDVDGFGKISSRGLYYGFEKHELIPLVPPDELAWQQFKTYLQPNPSILPPIVTTSDEEAARIAETTPGSHIHVVSRSGNVLSEYWGKPW